MKAVWRRLRLDPAREEMDSHWENQETAPMKAAAATKMCLDVFKHRLEHISYVNDLLHEFGVQVPTTVHTHNPPHPLAVIVALSLRACIPIMLKIYPMVDLRNRTRMTLVFFWDLGWHRLTFPDNRRVDYLREPATYIAGEEFAKDVMKVSMTLLKVLKAMHSRPKEKPRYGPMRELQRLSPNINISTWLSLINSNVRRRPKLDADTEVFYYSNDGIIVVDNLLENNKNDYRAILNWISYVVHMYFSPASSYTLQNMEHPLRTFRVCIDYMDALAPYAVQARYAEALGISRDHALIMRHIVAQMKKSIEGFFRWLSPDSRATAIEKFRNVSVLFGAPSQVSSPRQLEKYYSFLPKFKDPFIKYLIIAHRAHATAMLNNYNTGAIRDSIATSNQQAVFVSSVSAFYTLHTAYISTAFMASPLIEPTSLAATYGALGAVVGHELSHAFAETPVWSLATGENKIWMTPEEERMYRERLSCIKRLFDNKSSEPEEYQSDVAGSQITLAAAKEDPCRPLDGPSPMPGISNKQLFFIAHCNMFCAQVYSKVASLNRMRCRNAAFNSKEFYEAFGCRRGDQEMCELY
ncbi:neprilysin-1-like isoform X2 [Ornithodoros turicata]